VVDQGSPSLEIPDPPSFGRMLYVGLTKAERRRADDLIQELLDLVDDGHIAADGPAGVALVRRLEGAMLALRAMDGTVTPTSSRGQGNVESGIPESPAR
jgi:hypothetical protein